MQRPELFFLVHWLLPCFELQISDVPKQQMKTPANRRTDEVTAFNVSTEQIRCTSESAYTGESITSKSAYRIQTFNTTDWYTGESAYRRPASRRIRFQRSALQIDTPANRRTQANWLPSIGVSDSNVQHNRLLHHQSGVHRRIDYHQSAYQIPTVQHNRLVRRQSGVPANRQQPGLTVPAPNSTRSSTTLRLSE